MNENIPKCIQHQSQINGNSKSYKIQDPVENNCPSSFDVFCNYCSIRSINSIRSHIKVIIYDVSCSSNKNRRNYQQEKVKGLNQHFPIIETRINDIQIASNAVHCYSDYQ